LRQLTDLELQQVSSNLMAARDLELVIPGMYAAGQQIVTISFFHPTLRVIDSKQRPRRLVIRGSDGKDYTYVLKGHEDLRQDERVMQLFGLVNALFQSEPSTASNSFSIMRYSAIPLSPNSGLIEWLEDCDTMHALIKEYRDARRILLNIEQKLMVDMSKNHQSLTLIQKLEVFQHVLSCTTGIDLAKVLWLKSDSSETWLSRRGNYIRSVAVMSMVGYVLGLGDRHPCNIMIHRTSGKIAHIDFGDCFEVAMQREKYPEKIPFRLTRMMIRAMDISGIEGSFKTTCERVMKVIRSNKDSIMAVLEAFIHDPLVNWKLAKIDALPGSGMNEGLSDSLSKFGVDLDIKSGEGEELLGTSVKDAKSITRSYSMLGQRAIDSEVPSEVLNARAVKVISRVWNKLTGTDFDACTALDIKSQVCRLVHESTSAENLSQSYVGWCPFW
jgi:FKBP12-rapamycin complex-associated protein